MHHEVPSAQYSATALDFEMFLVHVNFQYAEFGLNGKIILKTVLVSFSVLISSSYVN